MFEFLIINTKFDTFDGQYDNWIMRENEGSRVKFKCTALHL